MDKRNIQEELSWMQDELRNLKSPQGAITNITTYTAYTSDIDKVLKITYENGENDIITKVYVVGQGLMDVILSAPANNEQLILTPDVAVGYSGGYQIVSTRPILSVENV